jgi:type II secretory pathway pseudopilin PulG
MEIVIAVALLGILATAALIYCFTSASRKIKALLGGRTAKKNTIAYSVFRN